MGKKCYLCNELATWINEKEEMGYCDRHFFQSDVDKEMEKYSKFVWVDEKLKEKLSLVDENH